MISCEKDDPNKILSTANYPMEVGTEWTYDRQIIVKKYQTNRITDIDTVNFISKVRIDNDTLLNDTMQVKVFIAQDNSASSWTSSQYNYVDNTGLRTYAYSNAGPLVFPKNSENWPTFNFQSLTDIWFLTNGELFYENPPTLNIKFPLEDNTSWTYRVASQQSSLQIDKEVVGVESLNLIDRNFNCAKVEWNYMFDTNYEGISTIDWIAEEGLIKRITIQDTVTVTNETGDSLYIAQIIESLTLKDLKLK